MSAGHTKLQAVNEILESVGEPPVTALETGTTTLAGIAETILDRESREVQAERWHVNSEEEVAYPFPTTRINVTAVTGTFRVDETVTGGTSGVTGRFAYILSGQMFLHSASGNFTGGETLTGGTSGATAIYTAATQATVTSSRIPLGSDILFVEPFSTSAFRDVHQRGDFIYDRDDNTFDFSQDLTMNRVVELAFTDLPVKLRTLVVMQSATEFQAAIKGGLVDARFAEEKLMRARREAYQEDSDTAKRNTFQTQEHRRFKGSRRIQQF